MRAHKRRDSLSNQGATAFFVAQFSSMANRSSVHINTARLERILRNLDKNTAKASGTMADLVVEGAKEAVPVLTGELRASIHAEDTESEGNTAETAVAMLGRGVFVELGTRHQAAQPFLTPAVRQMGRQLPKILRSVATDGE